MKRIQINIGILILTMAMMPFANAAIIVGKELPAATALKEQDSHTKSILFQVTKDQFENSHDILEYDAAGRKYFGFPDDDNFSKISQNQRVHLNIKPLDSAGKVFDGIIWVSATGFVTKRNDTVIFDKLLGKEGYNLAFTKEEVAGERMKYNLQPITPDAP